MKILFTGKENKGSWQIRAVQMAAGFAKVVPLASQKVCADADFIVVVKRTPPDLIRAIRDSGKPWAWDIVDAYPQPECARWTRDQAVEWVRTRIKELQPHTIVWPTHRMMVDVDVEGAVIPHHARPSIDCNPIRSKVEVIGYEGSAKYLGQWRHVLEHAAKRIGARFTDRPVSLASCDIVVALRDGDADCYATRHWKSNVKLANAHGSGTPFIGQRDSGYLETAVGAERWVESRADIATAIEGLIPERERRMVSEAFHRVHITVAQCQSQWTAVAERFQ